MKPKIKKKIKKQSLYTCQDCQKIVAKKDFYKGPCPFAEDVWGDVVHIEVCNDCYRERAEDI